MKPHEERVVAEYEDLGVKLSKLRPFLSTDLFKSLPLEEQHRLILQEYYMQGYMWVLHARIRAFPKTAPE